MGLEGCAGLSTPGPSRPAKAAATAATFHPARRVGPADAGHRGPGQPPPTDRTVAPALEWCPPWRDRTAHSRLPGHLSGWPPTPAYPRRQDVHRADGAPPSAGCRAAAPAHALALDGNAAARHDPSVG